ncbi:hypothetical protein [Egicoccus sp. AB-alg2]|uniref:hypothetical protein n=1 Tax=Egicoccus sp. AB-alg2 TaxID=3242693 RepID=UPI00359DD4CE
MERTVRVFLPIQGEARSLLAVFVDAPVRWLPEGHYGEGSGIEATVRAGALSRTVVARVGAPWVVGSTHWRSLQWDPLHDDGPARTDRFLPAFDGELGMHVAGDGRMTLILDGRYVPPGGAVGAALDGVALGRLAQRSLERFLEDVAERLQDAALSDAARSVAT